jgi:TPP-dependent pyruvate/acetoin dehydrogenase alpha subunit/pyruvate/2-oxoglutarate/acetoin dehydrogenase E1 component
MVNGLDIKPSTVASVPDIQDDDGNRNSGNMRPRAKDLDWKSVKAQLNKEFGLSDKGTYTRRKRDWHPPIFILPHFRVIETQPHIPTRISSLFYSCSNFTISSLSPITDIKKYEKVEKEGLLKGYEMMQLCRQFENSCNQAYMQGHIRGFMHLDNGQESIPALVADCIRKDDIKHSYYREHTHALASGVDAGKIMAELFAKVDGTCKGAGGSMHIFDVEHNFQGGWALVAEQLPYAVGAARSILLDRKRDPVKYANDDRMAIVFVGEGGAQNGRMAECLNAAAKEKLPILFLVIDNGRAINTFTPDVAQNNNVFAMGKHYSVPGCVVDGQNLEDTLRTGRAVTDYVRASGPAILQVHTFRFTGHSPADPEHERGRKEEKKWARAEADPIKIFEETGSASESELEAIKASTKAVVKGAVDFATKSQPPPASLGKELEYPDAPGTDYNARDVPAAFADITEATLDADALALCNQYIEKLHQDSAEGKITIGDAVNLAILEEMLRDPTTTIKAEDLQAGSSYNIPKLTQQTFGKLRASDEIIDEGHFIGKALGEGLNGYRPIVELMNTNFGIYGLAEISSAGNTFATTGGQFDMPMTIIGAGGTAPNQALGAEHSQPFHAYVMGIPGLKIATAASPEAAYSLAKSMIRDNGPGILFLPVKMMKEVKGSVARGLCMPLNKAAVLHKASDDAVKSKKAVTVLTYLHGVKESQMALQELQQQGYVFCCSLLAFSYMTWRLTIIPIPPPINHQSTILLSLLITIQVRHRLDRAAFSQASRRGHHP